MLIQKILLLKTPECRINILFIFSNLEKYRMDNAIQNFILQNWL